MRNEQMPLAVQKHDDGYIHVHSIWYTIQGEGPFIGRPAVFVRLHGCNLQCPNCDTLYLAKHAKEPIREVADRIERMVREHRPANGPLLIVFTGGEPLRQGLALRSLMIDLLTRQSISIEMQVETNGSLSPHLLIAADKNERELALPLIGMLMFTFVVSPKGSVHPHWYYLPESYQKTVYWKYVGGENNIADDGLPVSVLGMPTAPGRPPAIALAESRVMLQPEDHHDQFENYRNASACAESCLKHGYRYTTQLHKELGLP